MIIKVLLVDDSATARQALSFMLTSEPDMRVVGQATNGVQAVQMTKSLRPDIILMDVAMPTMDGIEATREIMDQCPTPIVIISGGPNVTETNVAFDAVRAGALFVLKKPPSPTSPGYAASVKQMLDTLRTMSGVRVIRHVKSAVSAGRSTDPVASMLAPSVPGSVGYGYKPRPEIISIASSTGGPQTLAEVLKSLPTTFRLPIVIVQHIAADFVGPLADWLRTVVKLPVLIANEGERPLPGKIYLAPGGTHLRLNSGRRFELTGTPANVPHIPSGDVLHSSVADAYGANAIGIVLTGMGRDGAAGLRAMFDRGAVTIAQDEATSIIFGMPKEAIDLGAARQILPPPAIARVLLEYSNAKQG